MPPVALLTLSAMLCTAPMRPRPSGEIVEIERLYDAGQFADLVRQAESALDAEGLTRAERITLRKLAGLAAFNIRDEATAERHFEALIRLDPTYRLDPFSVPPPAIELFERIRATVQLEDQPANPALPPAQTAATPHSFPFEVSLGMEQMATFNGLVARDPAGNPFVTRTPFGPGLGLGFNVLDGLWLTARVSFMFASVLPVDPSLQAKEWISFTWLDVLIGLRWESSTRPVRFFGDLEIGSSRANAQGRTIGDTTTQAWGVIQTLAMSLRGGVDVPITADGRWGARASVGLRGQFAPDAPAAVGPFALGAGAVLWGVDGTLIGYFRF